jgi:hypothetical protein
MREQSENQDRVPTRASTGGDPRHCKWCGRLLPIDRFTLTRHGKPGGRCLDCRREAKQEYENKRLARKRLRKRAKPLVITETDDPELRLALIRQALARVKESIARAEKRRREENNGETDLPESPDRWPDDIVRPRTPHS